DAFPSARMVHMIRDPRARWRLDRGSRRRPGSLGWETARWLRSAELADRNRRRDGGRDLTVRYEGLAADPPKTIRDRCAFVGEDCVPSVLHALATVRFDPEGAGDGSPAATFVERQAHDALSAFGYGSAPTGAASSTRPAFRPIDRAAMTAWRLLGVGSPA